MSLILPCVLVCRLVNCCDWDPFQQSPEGKIMKKLTRLLARNVKICYISFVSFLTSYFKRWVCKLLRQKIPYIMRKTNVTCVITAPIVRSVLTNNPYRANSMSLKEPGSKIRISILFKKVQNLLFKTIYRSWKYLCK